MALIKNNKRVVFFISFIDILAVSAIAPLLNLHLHSSGYSNVASGIVSSLYPCAQLIFSPIVGHYSDLHGRKPVLQVCLLICAISYTFLGIYNHILWILLLRTIIGIVKHTQLICKAVLEDEFSDSFQRDYGMLSGYTSIGFIIGPVIGGHLIGKNNGFFYLSLITGFFFFIDTFFVYYFLSNSQIQLSKKHNFERRTIFTDFKRIQWDNCWDIFLVKLTSTFAILTFLSNFSLSIKERYSVDSVFVGYMYSFRGIIGACTGLSINTWNKIIPKHWNNFHKLKISFIILAVTSLVQYFSLNLYIFIFTLIPITICGVFIRVISNELLLQKTSHENRGLLLGSFNNVSSVTRFLVSTVTGMILDVYGYDSIYILCFFAYICSIIIAHWRQNSIHSKMN